MVLTPRRNAGGFSLSEKTYIKMQFEPEIAKIVGTDAAIIYSNIEFWVEKNKANNKNEHDGCYWTYNSISAFNKLFYYLTEKKIRTCIKKLEENGFIKIGNYNKSNYDRTKWYTTNCQKGKLDLTKRSNGFDQTVTAIPNNKTNNKPNNKPNKLKLIGEAPDEVKRLYYLYLKQNKIPIANNNVLRSKIKEMKELYGEKWCIDYLNFMLKQYQYIESKYKPVINNALDLYTKSKAIQSLMVKMTKEEEIY